MSNDNMPWWVTSDPAHPAMRPVVPAQEVAPEPVAETATVEPAADMQDAY